MSQDLGRLMVALGVKDVAESAAFYRRLGFQPRDEDEWNEGYAVFQYEDFILQLMDFIPQKMLINLEVDDQPSVASAMARLAENGIAVQPAGKDNNGAYWLDPDGNSFYLYAHE